MPITLSPKQQTAAAAAVTIVSAVIIICAVAAIFWLIAAFLLRFSNVFLPIAVGAVSAMVFSPYYKLFRDRLRLPTPIALLAVIASILIPVVAFGWFFGALLVDQVSESIETFPQWSKEIEREFSARAPRIKSFFETNPWGIQIADALREQQDEALESLKTIVVGALTAGLAVGRGFGTLVSWAILPIYFAFFLISTPKKGANVDKLLPFLKKDTRDDIVYLVQQFIDILVAFFRGQIIIAFLQGLMFAFGFWAVGLKYGFVIGLTLGFLNIIPYLGSIIGLAAALPLAYFQPEGGLVLLGLVLAVFVIVQNIEGYLLTPKIMGDRTGLHPMLIIVAIFFWGSALNGILGMILAIPLTAFMVVFFRLAKEKYIQELV